MEIGVISDVHSNLVALEAVLADMPDVEAVVCAGDVVGYNPWPGACVERVREVAAATVMGNHDRSVVAGTGYPGNRMADAGVKFARRELTDGQIEWLAGLPDSRYEFDDRLRIVHGHPDDPDRYTMPEQFSGELLAGEDVLVMGHTHVQHCERYDEGVVLNPGSVGQPRDGDPRAAYALVDLDGLAVEERRVEYDVERVREAIGEAGLPARTGERLAEGR